jgi:hypothetical protein
MEKMPQNPLVKVFSSEIDARRREYDKAIDRAIRLLQDAKKDRPSTPLGHELATHATGLSIIAARLEAAKIALAFVVKN